MPFRDLEKISRLIFPRSSPTPTLVILIFVITLELACWPLVDESIPPFGTISLRLKRLVCQDKKQLARPEPASLR